MVTSQNALKKYGLPTNSNPNLVLWNIPEELQIPNLPKRMFINKDMIQPLRKALKNIIERCLVDEIKTYDGCFNIRKKRGQKSMSLHSWALAIDINAFENGFGQKPKMKLELVACFTDAGFEWGGRWAKPDGMHFQLAKI